MKTTTNDLHSNILQELKDSRWKSESEYKKL